MKCPHVVASIMDTVEVHSVLCRTFELEQLSPGQTAAVHAALAGQDVVVLMPTGGGKSLCFQLPAVVQTGVSVVICPLVALACDQISHMRRLGVNVASYMGVDDASERRNCLEDHTLKLLYTTPEQMASSATLQAWLMKMHASKMLTRIVLDEAHCVCTWGSGFRYAQQNCAHD